MNSAPEMGGCIVVDECFEVHVRNTLMRVGVGSADPRYWEDRAFLGAGLYIKPGEPTFGWLEGSSIVALAGDNTFH